MDNDDLDKLVSRVKYDLHKRKSTTPIKSQRPKKIRLGTDNRLPPGCFHVNLTPSGYSIGLDSKLQSGLISYKNREILDSIENGRLPETLSDWIQLDKVKIVDQCVKCAIIEKNQDGIVLSTRLIDLKLQSHGGEASQIINETCQLYRWSARDRLILDSCLSLSTSDPLCLNPSPAVHIINNLTQNRIRSRNCQNSTRQLLSIQEAPDLCSSSTSLSNGPISLPLFSPKTFQCGTIREVHLKTLLNSRQSQLKIRLVSLPDGHFNGQVNVDSDQPIHFYPNTPLDAEHYLRQYTQLHANNVTTNTTLVLARNGRIFYHESDEPFPSPMFPELESNQFDMIPSDSTPSSNSSPPTTTHFEPMDHIS